jgi:DNA-binding response OmpR family regulator
MEKQIKVHIFCLKPAICKLITKTFSLSNYLISCSHATLVDEKTLNDLGNDFDCIILDVDINNGTKNIIKNRFKNIPMICLPSLDSENDDDKGIKYISEPFRLSELVKTLDEIFVEK